MTASTCSIDQGSIWRCSRLGSRTELARHGFEAMSPSSTAAFEHGRHVGEHGADVGGGQCLLQLAEPGLDDRGLDAAQLPVAEVAGGVKAEP